MQVSKEAGEVKLEVEALVETGRVFRQQQWHHLAIDHFREAEWKSRTNNYRHNQAEALYERAATYLEPQKHLAFLMCWMILPGMKRGAGLTRF